MHYSNKNHENIRHFSSLDLLERTREISERSEGKAWLRISGIREIEDYIDKISAKMVIAEKDTVKAVWQHNPNTVQFAVDENGSKFGLFAYLPLTEVGALAIVSGEFDGLRPDLNFICSPGQSPVAIYCWLVWSPKRLSSMFAAMASDWNTICPPGCSFFTCGHSRATEKLWKACGLESAKKFYPSAPDNLLIALPSKNDQPKRPLLEVRPVLDFNDFTKVIAVRSATYLAEQFCTFDEEFDGNDLCASQFLGTSDGDAAGTVRVRYFGDFCKVERLAVRKEYRKSKLAYKLVRAALDHARKKGVTKAYGHSRFDLVRFWRVFGFREIPGRPKFSFANVDYVEMEATLEPMLDRVRIGGDPMRTVRPEGKWEEIGPLELSNLKVEDHKLALIQENTRFVRAGRNR
ncbi:GNAT family N-acetyltransferase [Parasphingorhabdus halotolerans]|uniref:GNAT family N-acetyltransferase n=1 Tax=Parasphingorhabdus halotolerans TaxID=2725558 RepID=A0A6H2DJJ6_9SPHN|nr:GNAT family N-acetyltransferase [Parasphingorhabdus halotolerans]QJB68560.1 GNAT family N-acetyltransferase [Parasphingorhabdus halotolerans]